MNITTKILIMNYENMLLSCQNILIGIDPGSELYSKTICIINDISQKIDLLKMEDQI